MSHAFIREGEDMRLSDVGPGIHALIFFLTKENNGIRVTELKNFTDGAGREVHSMSNGLSYSKDKKGKWEVYEK
jgi:hypothetical protein